MVMRQTLLIIVMAGVTLANGPSSAADETAEAVALADRLVSRFIKDDQRPWGPYPMDLALEAMVALFEATGDEKYKEYVLDVAQRRGWTPDKELRYGSPPFTCLIFEVYRLREDQRYMAPFVRQSRLYRQEIVRTADGLVTHPRGKQRGGGHAVLIDSLQEYAARMAKAGSLSGEESFFEECVAQYELHRKLLRDPETGLWCQGRGWLDEPDRLSPGVWSRGHGWLTRGMVDSLRYLPRDSEYFRRMQKIFQETSDSLLAVQDEDGMWHALLHLPHEKSAAESSGTGLIAYNLARAVHEGFVTEKPYKAAALRATAALRRFVTEDGDVLSACPGPGPLDSVKKYLGTTFAPGDHHGTGALIFGFAGEILLRREQPALRGASRATLEIHHHVLSVVEVQIHEVSLRVIFSVRPNFSGSSKARPAIPAVANSPVAIQQVNTFHAFILRTSSSLHAQAGKYSANLNDFTWAWRGERPASGRVGFSF